MNLNPQRKNCWNIYRMSVDFLFVNYWFMEFSGGVQWVLGVLVELFVDRRQSIILPLLIFSKYNYEIRIAGGAVRQSCFDGEKTS
jgi:hypothetical protein